MQKSISIRDRIVEGLCLALLCASSIYLVMMWKQIPKEILALFLPISMGLLFGSLIYYIIKLFKNQ